ncbi:MAG: hypothetical protein A2847_01890 [Candidatus Sungbacteria bacterium RIFCSPHIGHO2_01_FULL_50_25]|uniref:DDH domain-containing protein n=1 Tax=Candidatus Sungbacteria bacterium RIFCSPHIGHO2_01_FULL_50_25 TaxID=1802265 RepID=A0A1G2K9I3_9BACT|nr:MAG: hypothetical protein A2847_01890 [Candidatus Sungbacteria bacterium RIFCSPHIGHO2_01_FULL_50_25]
MDISRAIDFLEKGEHVGLLLPEHPPLDVLAAAEVLSRALSKRNKTVGFLHAIEIPRYAGNARFPFLEKTQKLPKEFVISLDTARSPASELRYEKTDSRIDVIFSPRSSVIQQEHVSFREGKLQCDSILSLGISNIESVSGAIADDPDIFTRTPIVAITSSKNPKPFGEISIAEERPHSEIAYSIVGALEKLPPEEHEATLLLAGILAATRGLTARSLAPETVLVVSELMRAGADISEALALSRERKPLSLVQLIGRAHVRSKSDFDDRVFWSFLTSEDFEKTGRDESDAPEVLRALSREVPWERALVLLFQSAKDSRVRGYVAGDDAVLARISESRGSEWIDGGILLPHTFETFKEAEDVVGSLLGYAL